jgi:lipopolysaccharide cholinephosphotransferase
MVTLNLKIDEKFFKEEVRCGYFISKEIKEIWAVELDLLNEFMRVCNKHKLVYYADAGTMLGAVRHGGMIPWDDDIDVIMMRNQYDKFCEIAPSEFKHPYFFQTEETDPGSLRGHAQLRNSETTGILESERKCKFRFNQGIFLDIFPIETVPEDSRMRKIQTDTLYRLRLKYLKYAYWTKERYVNPENRWKAYIKEIVYSICSIPINLCNLEHRYYDSFLKELIRYEGIESPYVAKLVLLPFKDRRLWRKTYFDGVVYFPFEFLTIPVPAGYKNILEIFYGNWQEYKMGTATHGGTFFDVNKPYTDYIQ